MEILEETVLEDAHAFPSALPATPREPALGLGHHPDRLRQLLRLLHRARGAGPGDQPALRRPSSTRSGSWSTDGVVEVTLLGQNVNSYGAGHHQAPPAVRRPAPGGRRHRGHPPGPLHQPAPQGPAARDDRGHGRDARRSASTSTCPSSRAATGSWPPCTGATPAERYLQKLAAARDAVADLAVTTDIIVGFPGETEDDFERTLEVAAEAEYDSAYTFIYSPRPGTEAADAGRRLRGPAMSSASASSACGSWSSARRSAQHAARVGRIEEVVVEGPARRDPTLTSGRTRQNKLVHFAVDGGLRARHRGRRSRSPGPAPTTCGATCSRSSPSPVTVSASRWSRAEPPSSTWPWSGPLLRASRPWPTPLAREAGDIEICSVDSMQVYRGMDIGTAKPTRGRAGRGPAPPARPGRPRPGLHRAEFQAALADALAEIEARGHRALLVGGHGPLPAGRGRRPDPAAAVPRGPGRAGGRARHRAAPRPPGRARPGRRRPHGADQPAPGRAGPGGHARQRPAVLELRPRPRRTIRRRPFALVGLWLPREVVAARIRARYAAPGRRRASSTRSGRCWPGPPGSPARPARPSGYRELSATSRTASRWRRPSPRPSTARPASPAGSGRGSGAITAIAVARSSREPTRGQTSWRPALRAERRRRDRDHAPPAHQAPRPGQRLPRAPRPRRRPSTSDADLARAVCDRTTGIGADGLIRARPGRRRRRRDAWSSGTPTAAGRDVRQRPPLPGPGPRAGRTRPAARLDRGHGPGDPRPAR